MERTRCVSHNFYRLTILIQVYLRDAVRIISNSMIDRVSREERTRVKVHRVMEDDNGITIYIGL